MPRANWLARCCLVAKSKMDVHADEAPLRKIAAAAFRIPTDGPEADGTFAWNSTTLVVASVSAADQLGLGYTYADGCITALICGALAKALEGRDVVDVPGCWLAMQRTVRNLGRSGLAACAISAINAALWDLRRRSWDSRSRGYLGTSGKASPSAAAVSRPTRTNSFATSSPAGSSGTDASSSR